MGRPFGQVNTNNLMLRVHDDQPVISLSASRGTITFHDADAPVSLDAKTVAKLLAAAPPGE